MKALHIALGLVCLPWAAMADTATNKSEGKGKELIYWTEITPQQVNAALKEREREADLIRFQKRLREAIKVLENDNPRQK